MIPGFQTIPEIKFVDGRDIIELMDDLAFFDNRSNQLINIPKGFQSDGASIPQFCWSVVGYPFQKNVRPAAILHDFLYRNKIFSKSICDQMFYDAMYYENVSYVKSQSFYIAVKTFGHKPYKNTQFEGKLKISKGDLQ